MKKLALALAAASLLVMTAQAEDAPRGYILNRKSETDDIV